MGVLKNSVSLKSHFFGKFKMSKLLRMVARNSVSSATLSPTSALSSVLKPMHRCQIHTGKQRRKVFEPDYLDEAGLMPPKYEALNIQLKGYNYDILENHQSYIHN